MRVFGTPKLRLRITIAAISLWSLSFIIKSIGRLTLTHAHNRMAFICSGANSKWFLNILLNTICCDGKYFSRMKFCTETAVRVFFFRTSQYFRMCAFCMTNSVVFIYHKHNSADSIAGRSTSVLAFRHQ